MTNNLPPAFCISGTMKSTEFSRRGFIKTAGMMVALRAAKLRGAVLPLTAPTALPPGCLATSKTTYPPMLDRFIAKLDPAQDDFVGEKYAADIQKILESWTRSLCTSAQDKSAVERHLSESITGCALSSSSVTPLRTAHPLTIERRTFNAVGLEGRTPFLQTLSEYLAAFKTLLTVELKIYGLRVTGESPLRVDTDICFDLVGATQGGAREQRVGSWHLSWAAENRDEPAQPQWMVLKWSADPEVRSRLMGAGFTDITGHCLNADSVGMSQLLPGIDDWRAVVDGASGIDVYGNHGIAVGDIDNSGFDSFYVCQPSGLPNRLYRNRCDGTFDDITDASGTGLLDGTASALFADFQNRGMQDLLVVRSGGPLLFSNMGNGKFEPRPDAFHFSRVPQGTFTGAAAVDYNRDGFLDIFFSVYSYYQGLNQYQFPSPYYDAQNGPPNFLFRNRGDGTFEEVTASSGMDQNNNRFSFAAAWCDFDNDGWPDLYVANDFGRKNLYRNNGDGTFTDVAAQEGVEDYGPGMSTCWLDYDNDGLEDVYVANMWLPEGRRITNDDQFLPGVDPAIRALYQKHNAGNSLYRNTGKEKFETTGSTSGMAMGGWSWSCASWDFDNDGWPDVYVANGFVSGSNLYDLQSFFWRQVAQRSLTPAGEAPDYEMAWNAINELVRSGYSWSGYQRNAFFVNNRDGTFSQASGTLGLDLIDDCRAYALSDFDHDGRLEFALKNRTGPQLKIIRNDLEGIGNSIAIRLTGRASNRDAIGAVVAIESGAPRQTKFISAGSGFASQHTKELLFGVDDATGPFAVSVRWPTGSISRYENLLVNQRVQIEEGVQAIKSEPYKSRPGSPLRSTAPLAAPVPPPTVRTWLIEPLFGPDLRLPDLGGTMHELAALKGQPVLLSFVRARCGDSGKQLEQLQQSISTLTSAGISLFVVAIVSEENRAELSDLAQTGPLTFPIHVADERATGAWNIQYRYLFDRRRDMSVPVSFLLDTNGAITCIYQGVVLANNVIMDRMTAPQTAEERFARALPFRGSYYGSEMKRDYLTYGIAFTEYGYVDEAAAAFKRAIDANPEHELAWFNLGTIYLNNKMYPEARKYLSEAVRLNPQDSDAWNNLGSISGMEEKYDEALDEFRHGALANPNHLTATENMMRIYRYQGRAADAEKALEELIAKAPEIAGLHLALAMTLVAQNDLTRGREELEISIRLKPDDPDALNNLGAVLLRLGRYSDARERFEQCLHLNPDFDRAAINLALVYSNAGQQDRARNTLLDFLVRHPDNADVRSALEKMGAQ